MKKKKGLLATVIAFTMLVSGCATGTAPTSTDKVPTEAPKRVSVTIATPPASSGSYAYVVACANALKAHAPQYDITTTETGGAVEGQTMLLKRQADIASVMSSLIDDQVKGVGTFKGFPDPGLRLMFYSAPAIMNWVVSDKSGVKSMQDLNGKKFNSGGQGTANDQDTRKMFKLLNINPDYYVASQGDAMTAMQDGRIAGLTKGGNYPDSVILQITTTVDSKLLGLTKEEAKQICDTYTYYAPYTIPGGTYKNNPNDVLSVASLSGMGTSVDVSDQLIYDFVTAMYKQDKIWKSAVPASMAMLDLFKLSCNSAIPLHSGAVQAYKDLGFDVPERLIPPEYKKK